MLDAKLIEYNSCFEEDLMDGTRSRKKESHTSKYKASHEQSCKESDSIMHSTAVSETAVNFDEVEISGKKVLVENIPYFGTVPLMFYLPKIDKVGYETHQEYVNLIT